MNLARQIAKDLEDAGCLMLVTSASIIAERLTSIEKENAAMREALRVELGKWNRTETHGQDDETEKSMHIAFIEAALSSEPTGKVLVDVEKLREIEFCYSNDLDVYWCPACGDAMAVMNDQGELTIMRDHSDECWLDAKIKEA